MSQQRFFSGKSGTMPADCIVMAAALVGLGLAVAGGVWSGWAALAPSAAFHGG